MTKLILWSVFVIHCNQFAAQATRQNSSGIFFNQPQMSNIFNSSLIMARMGQLFSILTNFTKG
jgi:hypothetical protein